MFFQWARAEQHFQKHNSLEQTAPLWTRSSAVGAKGGYRYNFEDILSPLNTVSLESWEQLKSVEVKISEANSALPTSPGLWHILTASTTALPLTHIMERSFTFYCSSTDTTKWDERVGFIFTFLWLFPPLCYHAGGISHPTTDWPPGMPMPRRAELQLLWQHCLQISQPPCM